MTERELLSQTFATSIPGRVRKVVRRHHTSVANCYGWPIWVYRVVECSPDQEGMLSERGVKLLWESEPITYFTTRRGTKCGEALREAHRLALGIDPDAPSGIVADYVSDLVG